MTPTTQKGFPMYSIPSHLIPNLVADLDGEYAVKVTAACFCQGAEEEIQVDFFRLWGRVIRRSYNCRNTVSTFHFVDGDDLEIFNAYYPARQ